MNISNLILEWCFEKQFDVKQSYFENHISYFDINGCAFKIVNNYEVSYLKSNSNGYYRLQIANVEDPNFFKKLEEVIRNYGVSSES